MDRMRPVPTFVAKFSRWKKGFVNPFWLLPVLIVLLSPALWAAERNIDADYIVDVWRTEEGLPQNSVLAIEQTRNGYLWLATYNGLVRFDGVRFVIFNARNTPELKNSRITQLYVDSLDRLWIIGESGSLTCFSDGKFKHYGKEDGVPGDVLSTCMDKKGNLRISMLWSDEIYRLNGTKFALDFAVPPRPQGRLYYLRPDAVEGIWAGKGTSLLHWGSEGFKVVDIPGPEIERFVHSFAPAREGGAWLADEAFIRLVRNGKLETEVRLIEKDLPSFLFEDNERNLWLGTWKTGLWRLSPSGTLERLTKVDGPSFGGIRNIIQDREGSLWLGTDIGGLVRLKKAAFRSFTVNDGLQGNTVRSIAQSQDGRHMVIGLDRLSRLEDGKFTQLDLYVPGLWSGVYDRHNNLWVCSYGEGLHLFANNWMDRIPINLGGGSMVILFLARNDMFWCGGNKSLWTYNPSLKEIKRQTVSGLSDVDVRAIAEDQAGRIYVGLNEKGFHCLENGTWKSFGPAEGLRHSSIGAITIDEEKTVWIGANDNSLIRFKNNQFFHYIDRSSGLPSSIISIVESGPELWLASNQGVYRVKKKELNDLADGVTNTLNPLRYGKKDGMASTECIGGGQPTAFRSHDGTLWFPTMRGLSVISPEKLSANKVPPNVAIEEILLDEKLVHEEPGGPRRLTVPAGRQRMAIWFTALSFVAPERVRFRYRMKGLDDEWVETDQRRFAVFSHIPPGTYDFEVMACNEDGVWSEKSASLHTVVLPFFWQTWWFKAGSGLALLLALAGVVRYVSTSQMRLKLAKMERQHTLEKERARISRDMHDEVGSSLTSISLLLRQQIDRLEKKPIEKETLLKIAEATDNTVLSLHELVWATLPRNDNLQSLSDFICQYAEEFLRPTGIRCFVRMESIAPDVMVESNVRHQLMLVTKEALNNVAKHSRATEVEVSVAWADSNFTMTISDNGTGFSFSERDQNRNGVRTMTERAQLLGGKVFWKSDRGNGTTVGVTLPLLRKEPGN